MQAVTNLIALGDNVFEINAAHKLYQKFESAFIKTIKFRSGPSTGELTKQIKLVLEQFNHICHSPKNLTVRLHRIENEDEKSNATGKVHGMRQRLEHSQGSYTGTGDHTANLVKGVKSSSAQRGSSPKTSQVRATSKGKIQGTIGMGGGNMALLRANGKIISKQQE